MATTNVLGAVYGTLFCSPGMNEAVKIDVKVSRKTILLLNNIIEYGISKENPLSLEIIGLVPPEAVEELKQFAGDCISKAGLKELGEKLSGLKA